MINRTILKSEHPLADILDDIVLAIGLLGRETFNKIIGIDPIFLKAFLPLVTKLLHYSKEHDYPSLALNLIKATGIFINQASTIPLKMIPFYKDLIELKILAEFTKIIESMDPAVRLFHILNLN